MRSRTLSRTTTIPIFDRRALAAYVAIAVASAVPAPFDWHLSLHVLGAVLLIGNALVMAVWLTAASLTHRESAQRSAARAVMAGDVWCTIPGVLLLAMNGVAMVFDRYGGLSGVATTPFIGIGMVLLVATGVAWGFGVLPAQAALLRIANAVGALDQGAFGGAMRRWSVWGIVATLLPILAVVIMRVKPGF